MSPSLSSRNFLSAYVSIFSAKYVMAGITRINAVRGRDISSCHFANIMNQAHQNSLHLVFARQLARFISMLDSSNWVLRTSGCAKQKNAMRYM